jgi:hypothetical protein
VIFCDVKKRWNDRDITPHEVVLLWCRGISLDSIGILRLILLMDITVVGLRGWREALGRDIAVPNEKRQDFSRIIEKYILIRALITKHLRASGV